MFTETRRGLGKSFPVTDLVLGLIKPSSYAGARSLLKKRIPIIDYLCFIE
jgi:hypothetical protein